MIGCEMQPIQFTYFITYALLATSVIVVPPAAIDNKICLGGDCITEWQGGDITQLNLTTVSTYNGSLTSGSLTGYEAANAICDAEFSGSHLCTEDDVASFIENGNISTISGFGRVIAGGAKYVPATIPVNDCQGLTYDGTTEALGNFWNFDVGYGVAANCAVEASLLCCQ